MESKISGKIKGVFSIEVVEDGKVVRTSHFNTFVELGYMALLRAFAGESGSVISRVNLGTDDDPTSFRDTAMGAPGIDITSLILVPTDASMQLVVAGQLGQLVGNGVTYYEAGMFAVDGTMIARVAFRDVNNSAVGYMKTANNYFNFSWVLPWGVITPLTVKSQFDVIYPDYSLEPDDWPAAYAWPPATEAPSDWPIDWTWPPYEWPPYLQTPVLITEWDPTGTPPPGWPSDAAWPQAGPRPDSWPENAPWPTTYWPPFYRS